MEAKKTVDRDRRLRDERRKGGGERETFLQIEPAKCNSKTHEKI